MGTPATQEREPFAIGAMRGFRYAALDADLLRRLPSWIQSGRVPEGEEVRAGRLYRHGRVMVKFYAPGTRLRDRLRPTPAIRAADLHERLKPVVTPRPVLALEGPIAGRNRSSLLAYEYVEGAHLTDLWNEDPAAVEAFPGFVAAMHRRRVYHGDFHLHNMLWDGTSWVLIDVDGIRHPLRTLFPRRLAIGHWSRVMYDLAYHCGAGGGDVRALFVDYANRLPLARRDAAWELVRRRARRHLAGASP